MAVRDDEGEWVSSSLVHLRRLVQFGSLSEALSAFRVAEEIGSALGMQTRYGDPSSSRASCAEDLAALRGVLEERCRSPFAESLLPESFFPRDTLWCFSGAASSRLGEFALRVLAPSSSGPPVRSEFAHVLLLSRASVELLRCELSFVSNEFIAPSSPALAETVAVLWCPGDPASAYADAFAAYRAARAVAASG